MRGQEAGKMTGCGSRCSTACGWDDRQKVTELATGYGTRESECWPHWPSVKGKTIRIPCGWSGGAVQTDTSMEMHRAGLRTRKKRGDRVPLVTLAQDLSEEQGKHLLLPPIESCVSSWPGTTLLMLWTPELQAKSKNAKLFLQGGKMSEVKTGSQVLADAIIEERTHQYKRRHGCFWTLCHAQNRQKEKYEYSSWLIIIPVISRLST